MDPVTRPRRELSRRRRTYRRRHPRVQPLGQPRVKLGAAVVNQTALPGLETGPPPWPAEHAHLAARLDSLGLPRLQMEADVLHVHLGGLCAGGGKDLLAWVDGNRVDANPARIELTQHEEIVLAYGRPNQTPAHLPSSYPFPSGL